MQTLAQRAKRAQNQRAKLERQMQRIQGRLSAAGNGGVTISPETGDVTQANPMEIGWMQDILAEMAASRTPAYAVSDRTEVIITQGYPLYITPTNGDQLVVAAKLAVQGSAQKAIATGLEAAVPVDITLDLGTIKSFGVRVKIADSINNFKYGVYNIQLLDGAAVLLDVYVKPATNVADVILLGINNNGGQGSIVPIAHPEVKILAATSSVTQGNSITAETLNERDLGLGMVPGSSAC